jgi:hypothetical protein
MLWHAAMIVLGIGLTGWGFAASHRLGKPLDLLAALAALAGVILGLTGALLVAVPGFFKG